MPHTHISTSKWQWTTFQLAVALPIDIKKPINFYYAFVPMCDDVSMCSLNGLSVWNEKAVYLCIALL